MKLHIVGSSGTFPAPGRPCAGYLIEHRNTRVLCDAGPGTFMSLPIDPDMIDAVVISHQHADHCSDLLTIFHAWSYRPNPRSDVPVYAPASVIERVASFVDHGQEDVFASTFRLQPVTGGDEVSIGDIGVRFADMYHSVPCVGSRWEAGGRSFFYTGDTGAAGDWREAARDVDLMLSEASYQESNKDPSYPMHLSAAEAGEIAREVGADKLVLTHIPPYLDAALSVHEAEQRFDRPVGLAVPGVGFDV
ncbi:MAG TPA: MBL fold metallo-hydrolase [Acidimicrobiia bacterium]